MDNFSGDQYDRFEAYRRHVLPKQAVRKVSIFCKDTLVRDFS
jgi:hTAFII28-like protein conserved region